MWCSLGWLLSGELDTESVTKPLVSPSHLLPLKPLTATLHLVNHCKPHPPSVGGMYIYTLPLHFQ